MGINDHGEIVGGMSETSDGAQLWTIGHACLWRAGRMQDLGAVSSENCSAAGINNRHQVVGTSTPGGILWDPDDPHAFLWQPNGTRVELGTGWANAINDQGRVVGYVTANPEEASMGGSSPETAVEWQPDKRRLGPFPGYTDSEAVAVNNAGVILIYAHGKSGSVDREYLDSEGGVFLQKQNHVASLGVGAPVALNNHGQVVGTDGDRAVLWQAGKRYDLSQRIIHNPGWTMFAATSINDRGQIVGFGKRRSKCHAILLTPK